MHNADGWRPSGFDQTGSVAICAYLVSESLWILYSILGDVDQMLNGFSADPENHSVIRKNLYQRPLSARRNCRAASTMLTSSGLGPPRSGAGAHHAAAGELGAQRLDLLLSAVKALARLPPARGWAVRVDIAAAW